MWVLGFPPVLQHSTTSQAQRGEAVGAHKGLVTNHGEGGGGYKTGGGGHMKFYPYEKGGGAENVLAMQEGGTKSFGIVFTR